jgi:uncharacterized membrane protein
VTLQKTNAIKQIANSATLQKHWLSILLLLLPIVSFTSSHMALLTAFIFTFLVPGLLASRFVKLKPYETIAFIPIFSVLVSTQLVYYASLLFGYSSITIIGSFLALAAVHAIVNAKKPRQYSFKGLREANPFSRATLVIFLLIFSISLVVLCRSVWFTNQTGIVITGSNWQDTPVHYEIIESLNNGNFPPEMPYYAGEKMNYHYFVDFHTAIMEKVYGFLPTLLPMLNAVFILIFAVSAYSLTRDNGEKAANFATIIATFGWGFSYLLLFSALSNGQFSPAQNYTYQYNGFFGLPPVFDNLLQQRPLLIGLPAFAFILTLLRNMEDRNRILLAGIITGLVFPFHMFSFLCAYVVYFLSALLNHKKFKLHSLLFFVSAAIALPLIVSGNVSVPITIAPIWALIFIKENPLFYYVANLGLPFLIAIASIIKVKETLWQTVFLALFLIPNIVSLTPNAWDMYKFFIFAWIPIAALSGAALAKIRRSIALALILLSVLASASVILYNVGTNYTAANWNEYNAGRWVRDNTEPKAVFLTYYSIHCPPTMIGGRLRVASYMNWAYGHGVALDDVYARVNDVDKAYTGTEADLKQVIEKYNVAYIYVGNEELSHYPQCTAKFDNITWLKPVYTESVRIYKAVV